MIDTNTSIQWYQRGPYQGYGIQDTGDGVRVWREGYGEPVELGWAANETLAQQMMEEDE